MPTAHPENLLQYATASSMHIYQQSHELCLVLHLLYPEGQFSGIVPGCSISFFLECDLEDIDVVVSSEDVFMRID